MLGASLLFGLVLMMLGGAVGIAAGQVNAAHRGDDRADADPPSWRATRLGAVACLTGGLLLFIFRPENVLVLGAITVGALALLAWSARPAAA